MMRCKCLLATIIMLLMCGVFVSFNSIKVEAASSKTLAVNWSNIAAVGNQPQGSDACACYSLAYCRTMLDGRVHSWSEYDVNGGNPYNSCASWSKGGYGSTPGVSSAQAAYRACYDSINNNRPAILFVTGSRSTWHYVTVIGYQNVTNANSLSASNFLIIDSCWFCSKSSAENMATAGYSAKNDGGYYYHLASSGSVASYDKNKIVIKNIKVTERTAVGYKVECDIVNDSTNQIKSVFFPTWTQKNDQDDLIWHKGSYSNKHASFYVKSSDHKNEIGTYITHIYCCAENSSSFIVSSQVGKEDGVGVNLPVSGTVIADASFTKPAAKMELGDKLSFGGTIRSDINIGKIIIGVYDLDGTAAVENIVQNANSKVYAVNSLDTSGIKKPGEYKIKISATTSKKTTVLLEQSLAVTGEVTTEEKTTEQKTEQVTKEENTTPILPEKSTICEHKYSNYLSNCDATCGKDGTMTGLCDKCHKAKITVIDKGSATGKHSWDNGTVIKEATIKTEGKIEYKCTECGAVKYDVIPVIKETITEPEIIPEEKSDSNGDESDSKGNAQYVEDKQYEDLSNDNQQEDIQPANQNNSASEKSLIEGNNASKTQKTAAENIKKTDVITIEEANISWNNTGDNDWEEDDLYVDSPIYKSVKNVKKRTLKIAIGGVSNVDGYEYTIAKVTNSSLKKFKKQVRNADDDKISFKGAKTYSLKSTTVKLSGLKKNKKYAVAVRAYRVIEGEKYYSDYSAVKCIKIKK